MFVYVTVDKDGFVEGYGSHRSMDTEIEVELSDMSFINDVGFGYKLADGVLVKDDDIILKNAKADKMEELSKRCNEAILGYFDVEVNSEIYSFSFDYEAQSNFIGTLTLFTKGLILEIEWTAHRNGRAERVILDEANFLKVAMTAFPAKDSKISRLRKELQPLVDNAQTMEELNSIKW